MVKGFQRSVSYTVYRGRGEKSRQMEASITLSERQEQSRTGCCFVLQRSKSRTATAITLSIGNEGQGTCRKTAQQVK